MKRFPLIRGDHGKTLPQLTKKCVLERVSLVKEPWDNPYINVVSIIFADPYAIEPF